MTAPADGLPPFPFRHRLIPAVHEVVPARFGASGVELGAAYAVVTALAANAALGPGGEPYGLRAGRVFVRVRPGLEIGPAAADEAGRTFHAWAGRRHPSGRIEVADLCTRHFNEWAAASGINLEARIPRAVWAFTDEVPRAFRYAEEPELSAKVRDAFLRAHRDGVAEAVREVLERVVAGPA